jgi:hypothetical protein
MPFTIALIAVLAAIIVLFSSEFAGMGKSMWKKDWVRLLLPLFAASYLAIGLADWLRYLIGTSIENVKYVEAYLNQLLPNWPYANYLSTLAILLGALFVLFALLFAIKKILRKDLPFTNEIIFFCWASMVILLLLPQ